LTIMVVPGFVMLVGGQSTLDDRQLGYVASWDINASAAAIGLATFLIARWSWRLLAAVGLVLIVLGSLFTALNHTYTAIVAARICAGIGEGLHRTLCQRRHSGGASEPGEPLRVRGGV
jgi:predicted MFS family arabinose efflux permease